MKLKFFLAAICFIVLSCSHSSYAQDVIHLRNGKTIEGSVVEILPGILKYKRADNPNGPIYSLKVRTVKKIEYENGEEEMFNRDDMPVPAKERRTGSAYDPKNYGNNIVSLAPVHMSNESAVGISAHFERMVDKNHFVSVVLPVAMVFVSRNDYNYNNNATARSTMTYIYPGVKFYPTGNDKPVSYSIGLSAGFGFGQMLYSTYNSGGYYSYEKISGSRGGLLINNGLNIHPTPKIYIGAELGLGYNYFNTFSKYNNTSYNFDDPYRDAPFVQFHIKFGYRF